MQINRIAWLAFAASLFHPFISFVAYNQSDLTTEQTLLTACLFLCFVACESVVFWALSRLRTVSYTTLLIGGALFHFAFFNYDSWLEQWTHRNEVWEPFISFIVAVTCALYLVFRYGNQRTIAQLALVFALGASALPAYRHATFLFSTWSQDTPAEPIQHTTSKPAKNTPNIYHIMMDGYARHDVLKTLGMDNTPFLNGLRKQGFRIAVNAHANYPLTRYSVSAMQAMKYLFKPNAQMPLGIGFYYHYMKADNAALNAYKQRGYRYIYADNTRYNPRLGCADSMDMCLRAKGDARYAWRSIFTPLVRKTPLYNFVRLLHGGLSIRELNTMLGTIDYTAPEPFYMFAMTLPPHYPYLYHADCSLRHPKSHNYARFDAEGDVQGYLSNVACTNLMVTEMTNSIIARDPTAIILLHSDHGSSFSFKKALPCPSCMSAEQMAERYPIIAAMRLPERCQKSVPETVSPVNFHRVILACIDDKEAALLPDISYINWYPFAYGGGDMFVYETNDKGQTPLDVSPSHQPN